MISDEELLKLNKEGYIPGPKEDSKNFLMRVKLSKKLVKDPQDFFINEKENPPFKIDQRILKPRWNWTRAQILSLFDISCQELALFYNDEGLHFFQAAATWIISLKNKEIKIPLLQFRKVLKSKPYLFFYTLDEILAHEAVHSLRVAFDEPKTEEIFAYMTASNLFRKIFGPIIRSEREIFVFFGLMSLFFCFQIMSLISLKWFYGFGAKFFITGAIAYFSLGLIRLFFVRRRVKKAFKKLFRIFNDKQRSRAVLFRLTDDEIYKFSKMKKEEIKNYFIKVKDLSLRLKMIYLAYFK